MPKGRDFTPLSVNIHFVRALDQVQHESLPLGLLNVPNVSHDAATIAVNTITPGAGLYICPSGSEMVTQICKCQFFTRLLNGKNIIQDFSLPGKRPSCRSNHRRFQVPARAWREERPSRSNSRPPAFPG